MRRWSIPKGLFPPLKFSRYYIYLQFPFLIRGGCSEGVWRLAIIRLSGYNIFHTLLSHWAICSGILLPKLDGGCPPYLWGLSHGRAVAVMRLTFRFPFLPGDPFSTLLCVSPAHCQPNAVLWSRVRCRLGWKGFCWGSSKCQQISLPWPSFKK